MRLTRLLSSLAAAALLTSALFADDLIKYKEWGSSPQGYFMTKAERAQWAAIKSDDEAEKFVNQFIASRGAGFVEEVALRAGVADKYLTLGKTPGSKTLRGKIIILLGPPKAMSVAERQMKGEHSATTAGYMSAASDAGMSMQDVSDAARREGMSGKMIKNYTFTYAGDKLPVPSAKDLTITVEAEATNGADRIADSKQAAALDQLFEAAAAAPVANTRPKP